MTQLIADLDAENFTARQKAYRELVKLGLDVEPALHKRLEGNPSVELRGRLEQLLEEVRVAGYAREVRRGLRALVVLERVGTPEAREVLKTLAAGCPGFLLTQEAQAALRRLDRTRRP